MLQSDQFFFKFYFVDYLDNVYKICGDKSYNKVCFHSGKIKVYAKYEDGTEFEDWFNTVLFAVGRDAETKNIGKQK